MSPTRTHPHALPADDNTHTPSPPRGGPGPGLRRVDAQGLPCLPGAVGGQVGASNWGPSGAYGLFRPQGSPSPSFQHRSPAARGSGGQGVKKDPLGVDQITLWISVGWQKETGNLGSYRGERSPPSGSPPNPPRLTWNQIRSIQLNKYLLNTYNKNQCQALKT